MPVADGLGDGDGARGLHHRGEVEGVSEVVGDLKGSWVVGHDAVRGVVLGARRDGASDVKGVEGSVAVLVDLDAKRVTVDVAKEEALDAVVKVRDQLHETRLELVSPLQVKAPAQTRSKMTNDVHSVDHRV